MWQRFRVGLPSSSALAACILFAGVAFAGAVEDYEKGDEAYRRDDLMGAMHWLRRAADQGYAPAQALLGFILDRAEENEDAFVLYNEAAQQGNTDGMFGLGNLYVTGEGVEQNNELAVMWITRAAEAGHGGATMELSEAYLDGALGLSPNRERAIEWLERGIERGYEPARERLSRIVAAP